VTRHWFVDSSVLLLASGAAHPGRVGAVAFLEGASRRGDAIHLSVEAIQEVAFHRLRRGVPRGTTLDEIERLRAAAVVHPFDEEVLARALLLMRATHLRGRDAVHAATAILAGFGEIVSSDRDFDSVPGLRRIDPGEAG
jgi:predicted nucleic acid-binding protein